MDPFNSLRGIVRYARELRRFLRHPLSSQPCRSAITHRLRARNENFLHTLDTCVYGNPRSPYLRLLNLAGVQFSDVVEWVRRSGVEGTLARLHDEGVYVTRDEFRGRQPIVRGNRELPVQVEDFDNPLASKDYEVWTTGSRSVRTEVMSFALVEHDTAYQAIFLDDFQLWDRPMAVWRPVPPGTAGLKIVLAHMKLGNPIAKWFSQNLITWRQERFVASIYASRLFGRALPLPVHVPLQLASQIAGWLAEQRAQGTPAWLDTNASSAVRVCLAAREQGVDISGTFFRLGGEPYTPAKAKVIADSRSRAVIPYAMSELDWIGIACAAPLDVDDVHLLTDKLAAIQQPKELGISGLTVGALFLTSLVSLTPKVMLNFETDDYAVVEERACGCALGQLGFYTHLRQIRSYAKLTSEGMSFVGGELIALIEEVLPARFGGQATDYQLVEEEENGLPRISVVISPRVGSVDDELLVHTVLTYLSGQHQARQMAADRWREAHTLRVMRREPYATGTAKTLPLHVLRNEPPP